MTWPSASGGCTGRGKSHWMEFDRLMGWLAAPTQNEHGDHKHSDHYDWVITMQWVTIDHPWRHGWWWLISGQLGRLVNTKWFPLSSESRSARDPLVFWCRASRKLKISKHPIKLTVRRPSGPFFRWVLTQMIWIRSSELHQIMKICSIKYKTSPGWAGQLDTWSSTLLSMTQL